MGPENFFRKWIFRKGRAKKLDTECVKTKDNCDPTLDPAGCRELQRYPPPRCLKRCKDEPFGYWSWRNVLVWFLADSGLTDFAQANSFRVPLLDHAAFDKELVRRSTTVRRTSADSVRANRVCAVLSAYMLVPYVVAFLLVLTFLANLGASLATQLYPLFLLLCFLLTAVTVSSGEDADNAEDEDAEDAEDEDVEDAEDEDAQDTEKEA